MRVLVTGATSLLGRTVVEQLANRGDDPVTFQRGSTGLAVPEYSGDVRDAASLSNAMVGVEAVVHVAGLVSANGAWDDFVSTNVQGTGNVLDAASKAGVSRFVQISSPSVAHYGASLVGAAAGPADPTKTRGHYATSKAMAELLALGSDSPEMSVVAIRPHLIWGPGDTQLVGRIVDRARQGRLATVGTGAALVDSTYIDNAASGVVAAMDRARDVHGQAFVLTNGQPRPVGELMRRIVMAAGMVPPTLKVPFAAAKAGGSAVDALWARRSTDREPPMTRFLAEQLGTAHWFDQRETQAALRWKPSVSLSEGFVRLKAWFDQQ